METTGRLRAAEHYRLLGLLCSGHENHHRRYWCIGGNIQPRVYEFSFCILFKAITNTGYLFSIIVCILGVLCVAWPLLGTAAVDAKGLALLLAAMLSYSAGAIYFSARQWNGLSLLAINGWQTLLGGIFLLPFAVWFYKPSANKFNGKFWISVGWLAVPVSIGAVQLWLWLLQKNAIRAGLWLFLCPLFGFVLAAWLMHDPISLYTIAGILLVMGGLLLSKINGRKNEAVFD